MAYKQLTREERYQIHALKKAGNSTAAIARLLGRHPSTIAREIERNTGGNGYRAGQAQARRHNAAKAVKFTEKVRQYVDEKLRLQWSPEQIAGRIERDIGETISHERIYSIQIPLFPGDPKTRSGTSPEFERRFTEIE